MDDREMKLEQMTSYGSKEAVIQNLEDAGCIAKVNRKELHLGGSV